MTITPKEVEIWVPHRISGFFQMMDPEKDYGADNLELIGSRGGGPALDSFIKTKINLLEYNNDVLDEKISQYYKLEGSNCYLIIKINQKDSSREALTSRSVVEYMKELIPKSKLENKIIMISHEFDLPMGCGYGSSGGGALGICYGLNLIFDLGLSLQESSKFAHIAEVKNHTGLGTVGGQVVGGLSISMNPGYPFKMDKILFDTKIRVVACSFGIVSTKKVLTNMTYRKIIHRSGKKAMKRMKNEFSVKNYIDVCQSFLQDTRLLDKLKLFKMEQLIHELNQFPLPKSCNNRPFGASLNQLGKSVFCICDKQVSESVVNIMKKYNPKVLKCLKINQTGPIIKKNDFFPS